MGGERKKKIEGKYSKVPSGKYPISSHFVIAEKRIRTISEARVPCRRIFMQQHPLLIAFSNG
jgi:hypothetical protein